MEILRQFILCECLYIDGKLYLFVHSLFGVMCFCHMDFTLIKGVSSLCSCYTFHTFVLLLLVINSQNISLYVTKSPRCEK